MRICPVCKVDVGIDYPLLHHVDTKDGKVRHINIGYKPNRKEGCGCSDTP